MNPVKLPEGFPPEPNATQTTDEREAIIISLTREAEAKRIADGLPSRGFQVRCDVVGCESQMTAATTIALAIATVGWHLSANPSEPCICPLREVHKYTVKKAAGLYVAPVAPGPNGVRR